jgi:hypothetical protein
MVMPPRTCLDGSARPLKQPPPYGLGATTSKALSHALQPTLGDTALPTPYQSAGNSYRWLWAKPKQSLAFSFDVSWLTQSDSPVDTAQL